MAISEAEIKRDILEGINEGEVNDGIRYCLKDGYLKVGDFIYRNEDTKNGGLYVNVKHMGLPENVQYNQLSQEEAEELDWAQRERIELFVSQLNKEYGNISIIGRSGGYWGLELTNIQDLIRADINEDILNNLVNDTIQNLEDSYGEDFDMGDVENSIYDEINYDASNYLTLYPTQKLENFKKDIEEEAKRWESMDFAQYVSLM